MHPLIWILLALMALAVVVSLILFWGAFGLARLFLRVLGRWISPGKYDMDEWRKKN
jgi:hypothetical protein